MAVRCATMVYLLPGQSGPNDRRQDGRAYIVQAASLARSLRTAADLSLTIYTNQVELVETALQGVDARFRPEVVALEVHREAPEGVKFAATPYKLDVLRALSRACTVDDIGVLLDTDIAMIRPFDPYVLDEVGHNGLGLYDITEQVMSHYSPATIADELSMLAGHRLIAPRWVGGEIYMGTSAGLTRLVDLADTTYERYVDAVDIVHHHGEEGFVSAAANQLHEQGRPFVDLGARMMITRHWSGVPYKSLDWVRQCSLVHLPGNKRLLERRASGSEPYPVAALLRSMRWANAMGRAKWVLRRRRRGSQPRQIGPVDHQLVSSGRPSS